MNNNCKHSDFFWGALVGGTVATLSAMFLTTKKGKQLQRQLGDVCEDVKETFFEAKDRVEETAKEAADSAEELGKKAIHKVKHDHK